MKNTTKILIALLIIGIIIISGMEFLCRLGIKCKNCVEISTSKEQSIENHFYLGEYKVLTKKIKLKNHDLEVEFSDAWFEKEWFINSDICLVRHKEKREGGYNVIFPFQKSKKEVFLFIMTPIINGNRCESGWGINENYKAINISELPDTIEIQIEEKNPIVGIGWREGGLIGEKVKYVKK
jgi:hypothetical protein